MNNIGKCWRDAASLIALTRRNNELLSRCGGGGVNYDVLLQTRTRGASFPNSVVFPGGVCEPTEKSERWLRLLASFGYTQKDFDSLHCSGSAVTPLFQENPVQRHIELRITAIRETFEELGLLICSRKHKKERDSIWADTVTDIDVKHWQERVAKSPEDLLTLCEEHSCYPDIWSLHYWSNWLTPTKRPKRFDTAFFVTALKDRPVNIKTNSEVVDVQWASPFEVLSNKQLVVYPPQAYELNRLAHVADIEQLIKIARERSCYSNELLYPVVLKASDGFLHLLPGDELYPTSVDYNDKSIKTVEKTVLQLRDGCRTIHRIEKISDKENNFVLKNYKPHHHINMEDTILSISLTL